MSPIAETTTTTSSPARRASTIRCATRLIRSASPTDEPPYFCTTRAMPRFYGDAVHQNACDTVSACPTSPSATPRRMIAGDRTAGAAQPTTKSAQTSSSRRPSKARPSVTSSAYSRSPPTGSPRGEPGDPDAHRLDQPGEVGRGGLALEVGVGREDQLGDGAVGEPGHQLADPQVVRADALDRGDRAAEHVVAAAELPGALDRDDVLGLLDDADDRQVAARVTADPALLLLGDVAADRAEPDLVLDLGQRRDQPANVDRVGGEQVERDPLGALRARRRAAGRARR